MIEAEPALGAVPVGGGTRFTVWAPRAELVEVVLAGGAHALAAGRYGYHAATVGGVGAGARYRFRLDGGPELADPASRWQPEGVDGPSAVVDPSSFGWTDATCTPSCG